MALVTQHVVNACQRIQRWHGTDITTEGGIVTIQHKQQDGALQL